MANTLELIASSTVGSGGAASIDFSSIPSTYTDLVLKYSLRTGTGSFPDLYISLNGSTSSFTNKNLYGSGSSAVSETTARLLGFGDSAGQTASTFSSGEAYLPNYAGSTNKSYSADNVSETNATGAYAHLIAGLWSNTAAINQVTITASTGSFVQYTTAYLYGVKNA